MDTPLKELRRWHRNAALRAKQAGFDIVYIYATHDYLLSHFLSPVTNTRTDEYGGNLINRIRLVRELIEETKELVGDKCAIAVRFSIDDGGGEDGVPVHNELREMFELLAQLPDLWDINISDYSYEMGVSRFVKQASLEPYMSFVKSVTSKPVVSVGRFTSPDTMVSQLKRGIVDFIGAARPSIADPFLPEKIKQGRVDEIRECIGCNICYASNTLAVPIRCTQNPTIGEEWRRGWHPENIAPKGSESKILIVGAGPCGLEAARAMGQRGYCVILAEAEKKLGGRVTKESALPGLSEWIRVRDYRVQQILKMNNVEVYRESKLGIDEILEVGADHVVVATGAQWRTDGFGRTNQSAMTELGPSEQLFSPDDIMNGRIPQTTTLIFDDDGYYMASVIAEKLKLANLDVIYVTPADRVSPWSVHTDEQHRVQRRLLELGMQIITANALKSFDGDQVVLSCVYSGVQSSVKAGSLLLVTARTPDNEIYYDLKDYLRLNPKTKQFSVSKIGDCDAPSIIADAVFSGHKWAREVDEHVDRDNPMKYDRVLI